MAMTDPELDDPKPDTDDEIRQTIAALEHIAAQMRPDETFEQWHARTSGQAG